MRGRRPRIATEPNAPGGLPIVNVYDGNSREAHAALGLTDAENVRNVSIDTFRLLPGDDASCLNLYEPQNPRVLGVNQQFIDAGRFRFQGSLASNDAERANPWLLLNRDMSGDGPVTVPVIADANSMTYVLHKSLGDEIVVDRGGQPLRLRLVAALADSIFQGELLMSDALVCAAPLVLGTLAYVFHWTGQRGNYGELIGPRPLAGAPFDGLRGKWILVTVDAPACEARCERKLYIVRQVRRGKEKNSRRCAR